MTREKQRDSKVQTKVWKSRVKAIVRVLATTKTEEEMLRKATRLMLRKANRLVNQELDKEAQEWLRSAHRLVGSILRDPEANSPETRATMLRTIIRTGDLENEYIIRLSYNLRAKIDKKGIDPDVLPVRLRMEDRPLEVLWGLEAN